MATPDARGGEARPVPRQLGRGQRTRPRPTRRADVTCAPGPMSDYRQRFFRYAIHMDGIRNIVRTGGVGNLNLSHEIVRDAVVHSLLSRGKLLISKALAPR